MSLEAEIIVVSGLPRSGTSLMMQMLDRGGIPIVTDRIRAADIDNPRGYYEWEVVKRTKQDASWVPQSRGKAVKLVSPLLYDLPVVERYRILFMQRDLDEVLDSQEKMLQRRNQAAVPRDQMKASFQLHLERLIGWLGQQRHMQLMPVVYHQLIAAPEQQLAKITHFLDRHLDHNAMLQTIDPTLYRNRNETEFGRSNF
jgi:hypothetical protein